MASLTLFQLLNPVLKNGIFTATLDYGLVFGNFDTIQNTTIRVFWYDNSTTTHTDYSISNTGGTIPISKITSGPYISVSGQALASGTVLSGNVLSGGTYYPVVASVNTETVTLRLSTGLTRTFVVDRTTWSPSLLSNTLNITIVSDVPTIGTPTDTTTDIANWIAANNPIQSVTNNIFTVAFYDTSGNQITSLFIGSSILSTADYNTLVSWASTNYGNKVKISTSGETISNPTGTLSFYQSAITNRISQIPTTTTNYSVIIKAINGTQKTFVISSTDNTTLNTPGFLAGGVILVSDTSTTSAINATSNDIGNFLGANSTGGTTGNLPPPTPAPTNLQSTVNGQDVTLTWTSQYPVSITMNGQLLTGTTLYGATTYTRFGLPIGTYVFSMFASNNGVNSTVVQVTATVSAPPPAQTNYSYNIQIPNVANALQLITATNYGTTSSISFPARAFVKTILNQDIPTIPNTLNALYITQVGTTPNEIQVANALIGYFPATPPQTGPKRSLLEYAGGIFAGLVTLSLFSGGSSKKGKR